MRDYAELVKALRCCSKIDARNNGCDSCPYEYCGDDCQNLCGCAADAIEEQSKRADELGEELTSAMELVHKRNEKIEKLQSELVTIRNQLPKHGEWIEVAMRIKCSVCGTDFNDEVTCCSDCYRWPWNYCPNCGAKMEVTSDA